jgi:hypothetical protein
VGANALVVNTANKWLGIGTTPTKLFHAINAGTAQGQIAGSSNITTLGNGAVSFTLTNSNATTNTWESFVFQGATGTIASLEVRNTDQTNRYGEFYFPVRGADGYLSRLTLTPTGAGFNTSSPGAAVQANAYASSIAMIARQNSTPGTVSIQEWQNSGGTALALIDYLGGGRFTGLRIDQAATAAVAAQSHYINVNINGTTYKLLLAS